MKDAIKFSSYKDDPIPYDKERFDHLKVSEIITDEDYLRKNDIGRKQNNQPRARTKTPVRSSPSS